jgi:parvulin-like peptidyl-prolyl isomerase
VRVAHAARRAGADFKALQKRYSDDPGDGQYEVSAASGLLPAFKRLSLRLALGGVDVVETRYGYHVVRRMK